MKIKIRLKGVIKSILWILLILTCLHIGTTLILKWKVNNKIKELRNAGEPVYPSDMVGPAIPDNQNGAVELSQAFRIIKSLKLPDDITGFHEPFGYQYTDIKKHDSKWFKKAEQKLSLVKPVYALIKAAATKQMIAFNNDLPVGYPSNYYKYDKQLRDIACILELKATINAKMGQMHQAADTILDMMRLSEKFLYKNSPNGTLRYSIFAVRSRQSIINSLQFGVFNNDDTQMLEKSLVSFDINKFTICYLREQRTNILGMSRYYLSHDDSLFDEASPIQAKIETKLFEPLLHYMDLNFLIYTDAAIKEYSKNHVISRRKLIAMGDFFGNSGQFPDEYYFTAIDKKQSYINLTRLVLRIKSYRQTKSKYPDSLSDLSSLIPTDAFTGRSYGYSKVGNGFAVYGKVTEKWNHPIIKNPTLEQKLKKQVLIGWIYKD